MPRPGTGFLPVRWLDWDRSMRRLLKKSLLAFYLLLTVSILFEIGVRLSGYAERQLYDSIYMRFALTQEIPYVHRPNLVKARARGLAVLNTDSLGLRSKTAGAQYGAHQDNEYRIALAGDSVTFGEGVKKTEDTFPQVLEDTLNQKQTEVKVKVFNYGASAYNVRVMAATLRYRMLDVEPNLVFMCLIPSDFNLARTPSVDVWGHLTNNTLSGFLTKDSRIRVLVRKVHFVYLMRDTIYPWLDSNWQETEDILTSGSLPEYESVRQFAETAKRHKLAYAIVRLPSEGRQFSDAFAQLHREGISLVDLSGIRDEFTRTSIGRVGLMGTLPHWFTEELVNHWLTISSKGT